MTLLRETDDESFREWNGMMNEIKREKKNY